MILFVIVVVAVPVAFAVAVTTFVEFCVKIHFHPNPFPSRKSFIAS